MSSFKKICIVVSDPITVRAFLVDQIILLSTHYEVTVLMNHVADDEWRNLFPNVIFKQVSICRKINLYFDIKALFEITTFFWKQKFAVVHSVTPKAGLLSMIAARLTGVPNRIHIFTGQVWVTKQGLKRRLFKSIDRFLASLTSGLLVDSRSQLDFLVRESIVRPGRGRVLGFGSISGVDIEKFVPDSLLRSRVRVALGIPEDGLVFLFLGRLNRDKGILDLVEAYRLFRSSGRNGYLILVGPDEMQLSALVRKVSGDYLGNVYLTGMTDTPQRYMAAADIFCLPSYREGFGSVIIEAASCGVPAIGSNIYGIVDAIVSDKTGLLHTPGDSQGLSECMIRLADDEGLRITMGRQARGRARAQFDKNILSQALLGFYQDLLD